MKTIILLFILVMINNFFIKTSGGYQPNKRINIGMVINH